MAARYEQVEELVKESFMDVEPAELEFCNRFLRVERHIHELLDFGHFPNEQIKLTTPTAMYLLDRPLVSNSNPNATERSVRVKSIYGKNIQTTVTYFPHDLDKAYLQSFPSRNKASGAEALRMGLFTLQEIAEALERPTSGTEINIDIKD